MGFHGWLRIMQENRLTRADLFSVKSNVCSLRTRLVLRSIRSDRGSIWMSDVHVSLRRFHRRPNNSFHPFGNAYKSCDSVATETTGATKSLRAWKIEGQRGKSRGFDRPCPVAGWKTRRRGKPAVCVPSRKGLFFIQNTRSFKPRNIGVIREIIAVLLMLE